MFVLPHVLLAALVVTTPAAPHPTLEVQIGVELMFEAGLHTEFALVAESTEYLTPVSVLVQQHRKVTLKLEPGEWRISCDDLKLWCPTIDVSSSSTVSLRIFRGGLLRGRLIATDEELKGLVVEGTVPAGRGKLPHASFLKRVELSPDGRFKIAVPAAVLDLRFATDGYVPQYRWGLDVPVSGVDIRTLRLIRGSSIAGFVTDGATGLPASGAEVLVLPDQDSSDDLDRQRGLGESPRTNEYGFFQSGALTPGLYRLEISAPHNQVQVLRGIQAIENTETVLSSIVLLPPLTLILELNPFEHPSGTPWKITLRSEADEELLPETDEETGVVYFDGLSPGTYELIVGGQDGSFWVREGISLHEDLVLTRDLSVVRVEGELTLNEEPLSASIHLSTLVADETTLQSDAESGEFSGWIRRPQREVLWVWVRADDPPFFRSLYVEEPRIRKGVLSLELSLFGSDVEGLVVDESGSPVRGADVSARDAGGEAIGEAESDADGSFLLSAIEPGSYLLSARHPSRGDSEPIPLELTKDRDPGPHRLTLTRRQTIRGTLLTSGGVPIAGAYIEITTVGPRPTNSRQTTELDGRFMFRVGAESTHAVFVVYAPSQVLWSGCLSIGPEVETIINLPPSPGGELTLVLTSESGRPPALTKGSIVVLTSDDGFLTISNLHKWMRLLGIPIPLASSGSEGDRFEVPRLAPGSYAVAVVPVPTTVLAEALCTGGPLPRVDWQQISPQLRSTLSLDLSQYNE